MKEIVAKINNMQGVLEYLCRHDSRVFSVSSIRTLRLFAWWGRP